MTVLLGIDPGSRSTGFGLIRLDAGAAVYEACGCIRPVSDALPDRLREIFNGIDEIVQQYRPAEVAIEQVFMARNAASALKLGQARGVAMVAAAQRGLPVFEYSARQVKQAVVGTGAAAKDQVQLMIQRLLSLSDAPQEDAADALAVALCHAHTRQSLIRVAGSRGSRRGRLR